MSRVVTTNNLKLIYYAFISIYIAIKFFFVNNLWLFMLKINCCTINEIYLSKKQTYLVFWACVWNSNIGIHEFVNWDEFFVITAYSMAKCLQLRAIIANDPAYGTKYGCPNVLVLDVQLHKLTNEIVCKSADLLMSIWMCAVPSVPWKKAARGWLFYRCQNVGTQLRTLYLIDRIKFHKHE